MLVLRATSVYRPLVAATKALSRSPSLSTRNLGRGESWRGEAREGNRRSNPFASTPTVGC
jgi:hypothetical protein